MELNKDFTLIIHGPLSIYTAFTLYRYKDKFPIIISTPRPQYLQDNSILKEIQQMMEGDGCKISLFLYDTDWPSTINNDQNRYAHFFSVYLALQACKSPYTIKMRSDEFYSNLEPFINAIIENKSKIVTNDVFFRNAKIPFHPSDHLLGGPTGVVLETFRTAKEICEGVDVSGLTSLLDYTKKLAAEFNASVNRDKNWFAAEQTLGLGAVLSQMSINKLREPDCVKLMKDMFFIVPATELGLFRVMFNSHKDGPRDFNNGLYFDEELDVNDIENYKLP